jgi:PIN domain nuclease of toxin-antitoxin system
MKYLIDTQILIWFQLFDDRLKPSVYQLLTNIENIILVSQVSLFEIAIKQKIGKLPNLNKSLGELIEIIENDGFELLNISNKHLKAYDAIPILEYHKDPFDRLILATAFSENIPIVSSDGNFRFYAPQIQLIEN